ncbi:MAG: Acetyl-CoA acetyltransferase [Smithella sp. PtaU1.Bin162]|nr:MAG: Acetyl-CoA acetyltransferase [Smithella sp. PtaU1.Bin162]
MREAVIVSAVRTPVGRCRGVLAPVPAHILGALTVKEAVKRAKIDPTEIEDVIYGNLFNNEIANMARMVALEAGLPIEVPGITLDRQCATSLNSIYYAAIMIQVGHADIVVAGGVESDSRRSYVMEKPSAAYAVANPKFITFQTSPQAIGDPSMGMTAENVAVKYNLKRQELDEFALLSHQKAARAWDAGYFNDQIIPVEVPHGKGKSLLVNKDESLRADLTLETLAKLPPAFKKNGIVTAGNSSPMNDGAGAMVIMEKSKAKAMGLEILANFKGFTSVGVDPNIMGVGPIFATRKLLAKTGVKMEDIDLIELNEAFAAQSIPCIRELSLNMDILNVNGGAIALGHPLAASGVIVATKLVYEMKRRDAHLGLVSFCVGGGQGASLLLTRE